MAKGTQKRSQCDNCPATKRVIPVKFHGKRLDLCEHCRLQLSKIAREVQAEAAASSGIRPAVDAGDMPGHHHHAAS